jgi:all-trans-retinol dehydrogenase (NAD+)
MSDLDWRDVNATVGVNLIAPFLLICAFLPAMIANNHGHIVNVSSLSAFVPPAGLADYGATKVGLLAMAEVSYSQ